VVIIFPNIGTERMSDPRAARVRGAEEEGLNNQVVPFKSPADPPMPGMLRKSTAFVRGTRSSNPPSSSAESAKHQSLSGGLLALVRSQEFVVVGWTDREGSRPWLGALLLAYFDPDGRLVYAGRAGTGIKQAELERLWRRLQPLITDKTPLEVPPPRMERRQLRRVGTISLSLQ
jgi:hypothetical protein